MYMSSSNTCAMLKSVVVVGCSRVLVFVIGLVVCLCFHLIVGCVYISVLLI